MISPTELGLRIYLDTNILIYAFEGVPEFQAQALEVLKTAESNGAQIVVSQLIYVELFPKLVREGRTDLIEIYHSFFEDEGLLEVLPVDRSVIDTAIKIRADYRLKTIDALHLASAISSECSSFISHDKALKRVDEIPVFCLD